LNREELIARWLTPDGIARRKRILDGIRANINWATILNGFPGTEEVKRGEDLRGINFSDEDLTGTDLTYVRFDYARLDRAKLAGANLQSSCLAEASLAAIQAHGVVDAKGFQVGLVEIHAPNACFDGADLSKALMFHSNFQEARFRGANLTRAALSNCNLRGADFTDSILADVDFSESIMDGAILPLR
jgi:uncharacterized protein YjbI with pentapeptide repeats